MNRPRIVPNHRSRSRLEGVLVSVVFLSLVLFFAVSLVARAAGQGTSPAVPDARRVRVDLRNVETATSGHRGVRSAAYIHLRPGETDRTYIETRPSGGAPLCGTLAGWSRDFDDARSGQGEHGRATHIWTAEARLVSAEIDRIVLDLTWTHYARNGAGTLEQVAGERSTITLREGDPYVLDFVRASDTDRRACSLANATIEVAASIDEQPPLADEVLTYDAWIVQENSRGERKTDHAQASARQGDPAQFAFKPLRWNVEGTGCTLYTQVIAYVSGEARGRVRPDGLIDIVLRPQRTITRFPAPGVGEAGERRFTAAPGEAVTFVLPPASGGGGSATPIPGGGTQFTQPAPFAANRDGTGFPCRPNTAPRSPLPPGVSFNTIPGSTLGPLLRVDVGQFLAGEKTSLVVTVKRAT